MRLGFFIFVAIGTLLLGWWSLSSANFNVDVLEMLPEEVDAVHGMKRLQDWYREGGELIVLLESDEDGVEDLLSFSEKLTAVLGAHPEVKSAVGSALWEQQSEGMAELVAYTWWNAEPERTQRLAEALAPGRSEERIAEAIDVIGTSMDAAEVGMRSYDPLGLLPVHLMREDDGALGRHSSQFVSEDGQVRAIFVKPAGVFGTYREAIAWVETIRGVGEAMVQESPEFRGKLRLTGEPAFVAEISGGMEKDMTSSILITVAGISVLFFLMNRVVLPLLYLVGALTVIFVLTFTVGRVLFAELNVMSIGFAAILIGLTVDYGVVIYQESKLHGGNSGLLRRRVGPAILWAAGTTAAVFFSLSFSSLPGVAQLGSMVGIGILIGSIVMLTGFVSLVAGVEKDTSQPRVFPLGHKIGSTRWVRVVSMALIGSAIGILAVNGLPAVDHGFEAMRPKDSEAMEAMERYQEAVIDGGSEETSWKLPLLVEGTDEGRFRELLMEVELWVEEHEKQGRFLSAWMPFDLWPRPERQETNGPLLMEIAADLSRYADELREAGFEEEVVSFLNAITDHWKVFGESDENLVWPAGEVSRDLLNRMLIRETGEQRMLGFVEIEAHEDILETLEGLDPPEGVFLTGWEVLGPRVMDLVRQDFPRVFLPMAGILVLALLAAYRRVGDLAFTLGIMVMSGILLLAVMSVTGMRWNFLNLCAVPLLFGTSLDYSIHMLLAMRRHAERPDLIRRGVGRALIFCAISTAVGFGSLGLASNQGLASLGIICSIGILSTMLVSVIFLPAWRGAVARNA